MIECISCPSTNRGIGDTRRHSQPELPKKISGYMGLSKIKVPKNNNNEDTSLGCTTPFSATIQCQTGSYHETQQNLSGSVPQFVPSPHLDNPQFRTVSSAKRWLITHGVTGRFDTMTACCSSFHRKPDVRFARRFFCGSFKCGCSRTGDLPSGKRLHNYGKIHHVFNGKIHELTGHVQ